MRPGDTIRIVNDYHNAGRYAIEHNETRIILLSNMTLLQLRKNFDFLHSDSQIQVRAERDLPTKAIAR